MVPQSKKLVPIFSIVAAVATVIAALGAIWSTWLLHQQITLDQRHARNLIIAEMQYVIRSTDEAPLKKMAALKTLLDIHDQENNRIDLTYSNFDKLKFTVLTLNNIDFSYSSFKNADLYSASFENSNLTSADLSGTILGKTLLDKATIGQTKCDRFTILPKGYTCHPDLGVKRM